jgi:hypothetical protein
LKIRSLKDEVFELNWGDELRNFYEEKVMIKIKVRGLEE